MKVRVDKDGELLVDGFDKIVIIDDSFKIVRGVTYKEQYWFSWENTDMDRRGTIERLINEWVEKRNLYKPKYLFKDEIITILYYFKENNILLGLETEMWLTKQMEN